MFCSNCGAQVPEGSNNCPNCGAPINLNQQNNSFNQYNNQQSGSYQQNTYQNYNQNVNGYQQYPYLNGQDKVVMALLAFFLGGFGIHCFCMGETRKGIIRILFTFLCGVGYIFALIDFVMILCDSYKVNPEAYFF